MTRVGPAAIRGMPATFLFNEQPIEAFTGESVAAALLAAGVTTLRRSPNGHPRGAFCFMGACQECVVQVDGRRVEACRLRVEHGLAVTSLP